MQTGHSHQLSSKKCTKSLTRGVPHRGKLKGVASSTAKSTAGEPASTA